MVFDVRDDRGTCDSRPLEARFTIERAFRDVHVTQARKARIQIRMIPGASIDDDNLALLDPRLGEDAIQASDRPMMERAGGNHYGYLRHCPLNPVVMQLSSDARRRLTNNKAGSLPHCNHLTCGSRTLLLSATITLEVALEGPAKKEPHIYPCEEHRRSE